MTPDSDNNHFGWIKGSLFANEFTVKLKFVNCKSYVRLATAYS